MPEADGDDLERLQGKVWGAEHGWGEPFTEPEALVAAGRALVLAAPGMGKSELLRLIAYDPDHGPALLTTVANVAAALEEPAADPGDPHNAGRHLAVARALSTARAEQPGIPLPDVRALQRTSYTFLLDTTACGC